jgi:hypothetical protein
MMTGLLMVAGPLFAHHNQASFDTKNVTTVKGTVKEYNWMNPHSMLILAVKDDKGEMIDWAIELAPPNSLHRDNGWTSTTFKVGDQVSVDGNAYKDGRKIMRPAKIVMPDGKDFVGRF